MHQTRLTRLVVVAGLVAALGVVPRMAGALPPTSIEPPGIRPCCPLGTDLGTRLGPLRAPISFDNVVAPGQLGWHRYAGRSALDERNGLVYTCAGGFIDTGHARSAADWTAYLYLVVRTQIGKPFSLPLEAEGGNALLRLLAADVPVERRDDIALAIAQRVSFDLAVWHEVVTWHGDASISSIYSELFSAFSPEDIYSDGMGVEIGARAIRSELPYDLAMSLELESSLAELGALGSADSRDALLAVRDVWWSPHVPLPEKNLLLRRNLAVGPEVTPWRIDAMASRCGGVVPPRLTQAPSTDSAGVPLSVYYVLDLGLSEAGGPALAAHVRGRNAPAPIATDEFPSLASAIAREAQAELGPQTTEWNGQAPQPPPSAAPSPTLADFQGIRLMQAGVFGGALRPRQPIGYGGIRVVGGEAESLGGDLSLVRYSLYYDDAGRGVVTHITGIQARALFFCRDRATGESHAPILAWFADCDGEGWLGVGGKLGQLQHDGETGRTVTRPLELYVVANALGNALNVDYLGAHANFFAGLSLDSASPPTSFRVPTVRDLEELGLDVDEAKRRLRQADVSLRAVGGLHLLWRSRDLRWQAQAYGVARQDVAEDNDIGIETVLRLTHRLLLRDETPHGPGPLWGMLTVDVEGGWTYFSRPPSSIADFAPPILSPTDKKTLYVLLSLGFSYERFTL